MNVTCKNCRRSFDLDEQRLIGVEALLCDCGQKLNLSGKADLNKLGKYTLVHKVATGGMGEIYYGKVSGIEGFEREVAIKKMLPHLNTDRSFVDMMVKEAKLTVLLNHPNIVQIYDLSKEDEQYYIAMEYVPGTTISAIMRDRITAKEKIPVAFCVHATIEILRGLHYAANLVTPDGVRLSIIHRDITPQNIMVTKRGFVKITDFGIAKAANEISTTMPGIIKGKLGYMAPEQLQGKEPDYRIDLYCAAIMLWEMLAGKRLFKGSTEMDTFRLVGEANVPALSAYRDDVDERLMAVVRKALHVDPDQRYQQGSEFAEALQQAIYPQTAEGYARDCIAWLQANAHMFKEVYVHHEDKSAGEVTTQQELEPVTKFTRVVSLPKKGRSPFVWGGAFALALVVAGFSAFSLGLFKGHNAEGLAHVQSSIAPAAVPAAAAPAVPAAAPVAAPVPAPPPPPVAPAPAAPAGPSEEEKAESRKERAAAQAAARARALAAKPLTGEEIQAGIAGHQGSIVRCLRDLDPKTRPAQVAAKVTIETTGAISAVSLEPPLPEPQAGCLQKAMRSIRFRRHPTDGLEVTIPLRLQAL